MFTAIGGSGCFARLSTIQETVPIAHDASQSPYLYPQITQITQITSIDGTVEYTVLRYYEVGLICHLTPLFLNLCNLRNLRMVFRVGS